MNFREFFKNSIKILNLNPINVFNRVFIAIIKQVIVCTRSPFSKEGDGAVQTGGHAKCRAWGNLQSYLNKLTRIVEKFQLRKKPKKNSRKKWNRDLIHFVVNCNEFKPHPSFHCAPLNQSLSSLTPSFLVKASEQKHLHHHHMPASFLIKNSFLFCSGYSIARIRACTQILLSSLSLSLSWSPAPVPLLLLLFSFNASQREN